MPILEKNLNNDMRREYCGLLQKIQYTTQHAEAKRASLIIKLAKTQLRKAIGSDKLQLRWLDSGNHCTVKDPTSDTLLGFLLYTYY